MALCIAAGIGLAISTRSNDRSAGPGETNIPENIVASEDVPAADDLQRVTGPIKVEGSAGARQSVDTSESDNQEATMCDHFKMKEGSWIRNPNGEILVLRNGECRLATSQEEAEITADEVNTYGE